MKRLITVIVAVMAVTACFAQASDFRDYIVTRQKSIPTSSDWGWDPCWGQNYNQKGWTKEATIHFLKNLVDVKEGKSNNGRVLFAFNKVPVNTESFWKISGFKCKWARNTQPASNVSDNNKKFFVERLNEWMEPFGFEVELARNSDIGRARYRHLCEYKDDGVYICIRSGRNYNAYKAAVKSNFTKIVKVVDNRGNLSYHPWGPEMIAYNKAHKGQKQNNNDLFDNVDNSNNPFTQETIIIK